MFEIETESALAVAPVGRVGCEVTGLGVALPERIVPNDPIAERLGVKPEWITERTGVRERRVADEDATVVDLACEAAEAALADAGLEATDIDLVVVATVTHELLCPAAAPLVADRIGTLNAGALDVNAACSGFLSALATGASMIETGRAGRALVIGADLMQTVIDQDDRSTAGIFADGGGAVVLSACDGPGRIGRIRFGSDGGRGELVYATREEALLRMKGHDTFRQAVERLEEVTRAAVADAGLAMDEVDLFVYHQANSRIIAAVGERLGIDPERAVDCIDRFGNTTAGTVPIALADARDRGLLHDGDRVLLGTFGGGLTWGAGVIEWGRGPGAADA